MTWGWSRLRDRARLGRVARARTSEVLARLLFLHLLVAVLTACLVATAFFSMFGKHWAGPWDSILAYANYFRRGSQPGEHSEPWYYYLQLFFADRPLKGIFWSEGLIALLALVGDALTRLPSAQGG